MKAFEFVRPDSARGAAEALAASEGALLKSGGIDALDRMKEGVDTPGRVVGLVDVTGDMREIQDVDGRIRIGALVTLAELEASPRVAEALWSLGHAAAEAASLQLRHVATLGGNLAQHTRCGYYRHASFPCRKRGDDDCPVREDGGVQELAGIFNNRVCASGHPSSLAPVLGTLDAVVRVTGPEGDRTIPFADLWAVPQAGRASDVTLGPAELITSVDVAPRDTAKGDRLGYEEIRQKAAFDWALASCAVRLRLADGKVAEASVWLGAVAPTPLEAVDARAVLEGKAWSDDLVAKAAEAAVAGATPLPGNTYKVQLTKVAVKRALERAHGRA
ncbi:MAG: FAD binding domain-containing protein [Planctomycetota bacterium]|jgi:xanthine dehydrogenase YagS FAD-binding subunit